MLEASEREFVASRRTATLVTVSERGIPRPVPICFVLSESPGDGAGVLYTPLDDKPKRSTDVRLLARVRDILARPEVTLLFERWSEDWSDLAWLRAHGSARLVEPMADSGIHRWAIEALRDKYPQYGVHHLEGSPLIRITIGRTVAWSAGGGTGPTLVAPWS